MRSARVRLAAPAPRCRAGAGLAVGLALTAAGCTDEGPPAAPPAPPVTSPSAPTSPSPSPPVPATTAPTPAPRGAQGGVVLGGEELGVTRLGAPFEEAVRAVTTVLGPPDEDPATTVHCHGTEREVRWGEFVLAARGGRLAGWTSRSSTIQTPSGVAVGSPLSALQQVHGSSLERIPADPDDGPTFAVEGVDVLGGLSSEGEDAVVTVLFSSSCAGP